MRNTTPIIVDEGGHFALYVDHNDGRGWVFGATVPTWRGAQVPAARERGYTEGADKIRNLAARYTDEHLPILPEIPSTEIRTRGFTVLSAERDEMPVFDTEENAQVWARENDITDALVLPIA